MTYIEIALYLDRSESGALGELIIRLGIRSPISFVDRLNLNVKNVFWFLFAEMVFKTYPRRSSYLVYDSM